MHIKLLKQKFQSQLYGLGRMWSAPVSAIAHSNPDLTILVYMVNVHYAEHADRLFTCLITYDQALLVGIIYLAIKPPFLLRHADWPATSKIAGDLRVKIPPAHE